MSARRGKTVNDRLKTRLADILIRFVARMDRLAGPAQGFPRSSREWAAIGPREKNFCRVAVLRLQPGGRSQGQAKHRVRSEEHTAELQSLMRTSYAVFCLKQTTKTDTT